MASVRPQSERPEPLPAYDVVVIGAGLSGLAALKQLADSTLTFIAFEKRTECGGIWRYEDSPTSFIRKREDVAKHQDDGDAARMIASECNDSGPMYESLRTNVPTDLMALHDAPFDPSAPAFASHSTVLDYLQCLGRRLEPCIRYGTNVDRLRRATDGERIGGARRWVVHLSDLIRTGDWRPREHLVTSSHVMICNGRDQTPQISARLSLLMAFLLSQALQPTLCSAS